MLVLFIDAEMTDGQDKGGGGGGLPSHFYLFHKGDGKLYFVFTSG